MKWEENERVVLQHIKNAGVGRELVPFSVRSQMDNMVLKKDKIVRVSEEYVPKTMVSKLSWVKRLRDKGYIEVDYTNRFKPKVALTEAGEKLLN